MFGGSKRSKGIRVESNWCSTVQTGKNGSGVTLKEKYMKTVVGAKTASDRME